MSPIIERGGSRILETERVVAMPKDSFIVIGPPTSGKSTQGLYLTETARAQVVRGREVLPELANELEPTRTLVPDERFVPALATQLRLLTSPRVIFDNIPRTAPQVQTVMEWAKRGGVNVHVARLTLTEDEVVDRASGRLVCPSCGESYSSVLKPSAKPGVCDKDGNALDKRKGDDPSTLRKGYKDHESIDEELVARLEEAGAIIHRIPASGTTSETARRLFTELSPILFYKAEMAAGYYRLLESLKRTDSRHIMFSGVPVYYYGGRALMKDFDIMVPDNRISAIATDLQLQPGVKDSSVAYTRFVDIASGVEINSDVSVKTPHQRINFPFDFVWGEVVYTRIMGLQVPLMGLEDTVLFKAALGRLGPDDWGKHKDDLSDIEGLLGAQSVNFSKLTHRADQLGMASRLREVLARINVTI